MDDIRLLTKIASLYYKGRLTQQEIADRLGISRPTTSRYLKRAEDLGIVQIEISSTLLYSTELENELEKVFSLKEAVVVSPASDSEDSLKNGMGEAGAAFLERRVQTGDMIAVSWSSTVLQCAMHLGEAETHGVNVVQMNGSLDRTTYSTRAEYIIERIAKAFKGRAVSLLAPMSVDHPSIKESLLSDSRLSATLEMAEQAPLALFGVGHISEQSSLYKAGYMDAEMLERLRSAGAVGEICGRFYDASGEICVPEYDDRTIAVELKNLRTKRFSIAIAGGLDKVAAMRGMLRGRYCNVLITTDDTAKALLAG